MEAIDNFRYLVKVGKNSVVACGFSFGLLDGVLQEANAVRVSLGSQIGLPRFGYVVLLMRDAIEIQDGVGFNGFEGSLVDKGSIAPKPNIVSTERFHYLMGFKIDLMEGISAVIVFFLAQIVVGT